MATSCLASQLYSLVTPRDVEGGLQIGRESTLKGVKTEVNYKHSCDITGGVGNFWQRLMAWLEQVSTMTSLIKDFVGITRSLPAQNQNCCRVL